MSVICLLCKQTKFKGGTKVIKPKIIFLLAAFLLIAICSTAAAAPPSSQEANQIDPDALLLISNGDVSLGTKMGGLWVEGFTETYTSVDEVGVTAYLQHWNGNRWVDIDWETRSSQNFFMVISSFITDVPTGQYYRAKAVHWAVDDGFYESATSYSGVIQY